MQTFDQCLQDLVIRGDVTFETAKGAASNPNDFELKMTMFSQHAQDANARASQATAIQGVEVEKPADGSGMLEGMTGGMDFVVQP
jgi:Tfp pilus assembly ATPase PilU